MALGFNQAGLLFATSRKSTVERKAMGIANDKISLSRESQALSEDYSRQQNLRKLVWEDSQGVQNDIAFNTITAPFSTGNTNYIMTNVGGRMVVDSSMMARFGLVGDMGNLRDQGVSRNQFLAQFDDPFAEVAGTKIDPTRFTPGPGITMQRNEIEVMTPKTSILKQDLEELEVFKNEIYNQITDKIVGEDTINNSNINGYVDRFDSMLESNETLLDMLNYMLGRAQAGIAKLPPNAATSRPGDKEYNQYKQYKSEIEILQKEIGLYTKLDTLLNNAKNSGTTTGGIAAVAWLFSDRTITSMVHDGENIVGDGKLRVWDATLLLKGAGFISGTKGTRGRGSADIITGHGSVGGRGGKVGDNMQEIFNKDKATLEKAIRDCLPPDDLGSGGTANAVTTQDYVDYYDSIWKHLYYKGWIKEERVNDPKFLENSLRSGGIYIEKQAPGYSFSRIAWQTDASCALRDVRDKTGVNLAQIDYERKKAQLDQKEGMMDVEMRNLDMERAALEAQIDTMKAVITKNVERSFKMFTA